MKPNCGTGEYKFTSPSKKKERLRAERSSALKSSEGTGEIEPTEGEARSFTDKVKFGGLQRKGKKIEHDSDNRADRIGIPRQRHRVDRQRSQIVLGAKCTIYPRAGQTVGGEEVEEGKKGPVDLPPDRRTAARHPGRSQNQDPHPRRRRSRRARISKAKAGTAKTRTQVRRRQIQGQHARPRQIDRKKTPGSASTKKRSSFRKNRFSSNVTPRGCRRPRVVRGERAAGGPLPLFCRRLPAVVRDARAGPGSDRVHG